MPGGRRTAALLAAGLAAALLVVAGAVALRVAPRASDALLGPAGGEVAGDAARPLDVEFVHVRGHGWWVQAEVVGRAAGDVAAVEVRSDGGPWQPLQQRPWGPWTGSHHVVQGAHVELRATGRDGATAVDGCYRWIPPANGDARRGSCGEGEPPSAWTERTLATMPGRLAMDVASGDVDGDGRAESYVAEAGGVFRVTGSGLAKVSDRREWHRLAVGDGDGDGRQEIYATRWLDGQGGMELRRIHWSGSAWKDQAILHGTFLGDVAIGDVDPAGEAGAGQVYVGFHQEGAWVVQLRSGAAGWAYREVWRLGDGSLHGLVDLETGDTDGDGRPELLASAVGPRAGLWLLEGGGSPWAATRLPSPGTFQQGVVVADLDGDHVPEVAAAGGEGGLHLLRRAAGAWESQEVPLDERLDGVVFLRMAHGDGDGDGSAELYLSAAGAGVYSAKPVAGAGAAAGHGWETSFLGELPGGQPVGGPVAVSEGDGGDGPEVHVAAYDMDTQTGRVVGYRRA